MFQFSIRKSTVFALGVLVLVGISAYFGETVRPFGVAERIVSMTVNELEAHSQKVVDSGKKKKDTKPPPRPRPSSGTYIVRKGDTVFSISKEYGVHPELLKLRNNIGSNNRIIAGRQLFIPQSEG